MAAELTFGQKAVRLSFNPPDNVDIERLKQLYAAIIDYHHEAAEKAGDGETTRLHKIAITEAQGAQMWSVRAIAQGL